MNQVVASQGLGEYRSQPVLHCSTYTACGTIRNVSVDIERALRERAIREAKIIDQVATEALVRGLGLRCRQVRHRDLGAIAGSWVHDGEVDRALDEQRTR